MPAGLPRVCLVPNGKDTEAIRDYHCTEPPRPRDVIYPPARHWAVRDLLDLWGEYPGLCQGAIDDCNRSWKVIMAAEGEAYAAKLLEERLDDAGWPLASYLAIIGGAAIGVAVGIVVGFVAGL